MLHLPVVLIGKCKLNSKSVLTECPGPPVTSVVNLVMILPQASKGVAHLESSKSLALLQNFPSAAPNSKYTPLCLSWKYRFVAMMSL